MSMSSKLIIIFLIISNISLIFVNVLQKTPNKQNISIISQQNRIIRDLKEECSARISTWEMDYRICEERKIEVETELYILKKMRGKIQW